MSIGLVAALSDRLLGYALAAAVGVLIVFVMWRHPGPALILLAVILPLQQTGLGLLVWAGFGTGVARAASGITEVLVVSVCLSALRAVWAERRRPAFVDLAAATYLGVLAVYLLVPHVFATGAPSAWHTQLEALRSDAGYVVVFLAARHAPISARARLGLRTTIMAVGTVIVAGAFVEELFPHSWQTFMLQYADAPTYLRGVLGQTQNQTNDALRYIYNLGNLRVSSFFYSPFDMADYLLIVAVVCIERVVRGDRTGRPLALFLATLAALWFSQVRADALALGLVAFVAATRRYHPRQARLLFVAVLAVGAIVSVPAFAGSRFSGSQGAAASSSVHLDELGHGIRVFADHPLGLGLGEQSVNGLLLPASGGGSISLTTDNAETQVADELGVFGLLTWLGFMAATMVGLIRTRATTAKFWSGAAMLALVAIWTAGQNHQVFVEFAVPWVLWTLVGVGLPYTPLSRSASPSTKTAPLVAA